MAPSWDSKNTRRSPKAITAILAEILFFEPNIWVEVRLKMTIPERYLQG